MKNSMVDSTCVEDFVRLNGNDVRRLVHSKIWYDKDLQKDMAQQFYLALCTDGILERYDSSRGAKFSTYITSCLNNVINATFQPIHETVTINDDIRSYNPEPSYDMSLRVGRLRDFIITHTDSTRPLDYLEYKAHGRRVRDLGQMARNEYTDLLHKYLFAEKLAEDIQG
jgi:hypothetical protein